MTEPGDTPTPTPRSRKQQLMKPANAAKKLGILLEAAPEEFQKGEISRVQLNELLANPPAWLVDLRLAGPHPRQIVASKLGVSISGLARGEVTEPLTTAEISALLKAPPQWLVQERSTQAGVRSEQLRVKERDAERAARARRDERDERNATRGGGGGGGE